MGYIGFSMSENAALAYAEGKKPLSGWKKDELVAGAIAGGASPACKKLTVAELKKAVLCCTEWHHTGSYYNCTDFYEIDADRAEELTEEAITKIIELRARRKKESAPAPAPRAARVIYYEWYGSRRYPQKIKCEDEGVIVGNWFFIGGLGGRKKSLNGNGICSIAYLDAPEREGGDI